MNENLKELVEQSTRRQFDGSGSDSGKLVFDKALFAELIIKQCAKSLWTEECHNSDLALEEFERNSAKIKEHFGVK